MSFSRITDSVFEEVLDGGGALLGRGERAEEADYDKEEADYDKNARKLDFEGHLRSLVLLHTVLLHTVLLHTTAYESARDLTWAAEEDLLFEALGADFDISVRGLGGALGRRSFGPIARSSRTGRCSTGCRRPSRSFPTSAYAAPPAPTRPHQRLRGISTEEWGEIADLFGSFWHGRPV